MKKLLLLFAVMFMAFSANSAYYLIGGFNDWKLADSRCQFKAGSNGDYTLDLPDDLPLTSGFKINAGNWSDGNNNFGAGGTLEVGVTYNLNVSSTSGNILFKVDGTTIPNAHLVFNPTKKTLLVTGKTEEATTIYGIHTDIFGDSAWETVNMTEGSDGKWTLTKQATVAGSFGIKAMNSITGSQTAWYSAGNATDAVIEVGKTVTCVADGSSNFSIAKGNYTFTFDPKTLQLTVTGTSEGEAPKPNPYEGWWFNLLGDFNNWETDNSGTQITEANPVAKWTNQVIGTTGFKIKTWDGSNNTYYISADSSITPGVETEFFVDEFDAPAVTIDGATATTAFDVEFNFVTKMVKVTVVGGQVDPTPDPTYPDKMYVIGEINGGKWDPASGVEMINEGDGFYTAENVKIDNYFALTSVLGTWDDVNANRFGPAVGGTQAVEGENEANGTGDTSWQIAIPGTYNMYFSYDDKILELDPVSVETPDPQEEWYVIINGGFNDWSTDGAIQSKDGVYNYSGLKIGGDVEFEINIWNGIQNLYYGTSTPLTVGAVVEVVPNGGHMTLDAPEAEEGYNVTFTYDETKSTISVTGTTGVEGIVTEEAPAVYFNLQGVRVDKPENGVFIVRQGNKTSKVIL